jgi:hypothetical protein
MKHIKLNKLSKAISAENGHVSGIADYIFLMPQDIDFSSKERYLDKFLDFEGIFQINLGAVLNEYAIK